MGENSSKQWFCWNNKLPRKSSGENRTTEGKKSEKPEDVAEEKNKRDYSACKWTNSEIKFGIWEY